MTSKLPSSKGRTNSTLTPCVQGLCGPFIQALLEASASRSRPAYLEFDPSKATGKVLAAPTREDMPFTVNTQGVVEYYSQKL